MVIFYSYVSLPEGTVNIVCVVGLQARAARAVLFLRLNQKVDAAQMHWALRKKHYYVKSIDTTCRPEDSLDVLFTLPGFWRFINLFTGFQLIPLFLCFAMFCSHSFTRSFLHVRGIEYVYCHYMIRSTVCIPASGWLNYATSPDWWWNLLLSTVCCKLARVGQGSWWGQPQSRGCYGAKV